MLDYGWADWVSGQVERVWDLMDISLLRSAVLGVDPSYKRCIGAFFFGVDSDEFFSQPSVELISECRPLDWVESCWHLTVPNTFHDSLYH